MHQEFHETFQLDAPPGAVWAIMSDIPTVLSWISIVETVEEVEPGERFGVVLADKLGPFKLRADLNVVVGEREPGTRIRARGDGEDRQIGSRLIIEVALALEERDASTQLDVSGSYEVTGRPASLGAGAIRKKAANILAEFFASAEKSLGAVTSSEPA
jgi:carbon monoxide dehydrogenase subunit G